MLLQLKMQKIEYIIYQYNLKRFLRIKQQREDFAVMKNPLVRIKELRNCMGESERIIADYLLDDPNAVLEFNIRELAGKLYVSSATIVRFCKHLGFSGYREFRQALIYELAMYAKNSNEENLDIVRGDSVKEIAKKITNKNMLSLRETEKMLDMEMLSSCVDLIHHASNLILFGIGASHNVAKDAYLKFLRLNKPCSVSEDWHAQLLMAKNSSRRDVAIMISYSGETREMVECMQALQENRTPTIVITRFAPSTLSSMSTYVLYVSAEESVFRSGAMSSRIAQLNIIDILYTAYATRSYDDSLWYLKKTHIGK